MAGKRYPAKKVGILALQGDVDVHAKKLKELGVESVPVKIPAQLKGLNGLIIPGGESTALIKLSKPISMLEAIKEYYKSGGHIFGTCAGAILLASSVTNPVQESAALIDISIERNGYGRQLQSLETAGQAVAPLPKNLPMTFIRAPKIKSVGNGVKVLASYQNDPVLVESDRILLATFHPELTQDDSVFKYWLSKNLV